MSTIDRRGHIVSIIWELKKEGIYFLDMPFIHFVESMPGPEFQFAIPKYPITKGERFIAFPLRDIVTKDPHGTPLLRLIYDQLKKATGFIVHRDAVTFRRAARRWYINAALNDLYQAIQRTRWTHVIVDVDDAWCSS